MVQSIERDLARFRDVIKGKIRKDLRRYISHGEMIGKRGRDFVSIPVPQLDIPHFRYGDKNNGGVSAGPGSVGQPLPGQPGQDPGAGSESSDHLLEVEVTLDELAAMLGDELELPAIKPKGSDDVVHRRDRYTGIGPRGPESLRHFRRTYKQALRRQIAAKQYHAVDPRIIPIREDYRYRIAKPLVVPRTNAVVFHLMDVSGSMGQEQKEIVRIESFWIDTWLRSFYQGVEVRYIVHDAEAREVDAHTFFHTRESGGTRISSAYKLVKQCIDERFPTADWNIYILHYSDGDNWGEDDPICVQLLTQDLLPIVNLFGYSQVLSAYGSGRFLEELRGVVGSYSNVALVEVSDRDHILDGIRGILGKGR